MISCPRITDNGIISLGQAMEKLNLLESLTLDFSRDFFMRNVFEHEEITNKGLNFIIKGLEKLQCLKSLSLDFTE